MNIRNIFLKYLGWCPLTPADSSKKLSLERQNKVKEIGTISRRDNHHYQICPKCKKLVPETDLFCPYCNASLSSEYTECPFCNNRISGEDTVCPYCGELLIYEYPKQVTAKRNAVLFPLGFLLLFSIMVYWYLDWQNIIKADNVFGVSFVVLWLIGFVLFGVYIGKGDRDFWWGK